MNLFKTKNKEFLLCQDHHLPLDFMSHLVSRHQILLGAHGSESRCVMLANDPLTATLPPVTHLQRGQEQLPAYSPERMPCAKPNARTEDPPDAAWLVVMAGGAGRQR